MPRLFLPSVGPPQCPRPCARLPKACIVAWRRDYEPISPRVSPMRGILEETSHRFRGKPFTRRDGDDFFDTAPRVPAVITKTETFPLNKPTLRIGRRGCSTARGSAPPLTQVIR